MWLISVLVIIPVLYVATGRELPVEVAQRLEDLFPKDAAPTAQYLALAFIGGMFVGGTHLHIVVRYLSTVVHELGHAFVAGILGGRPKNITIATNAGGLAVYQPPLGWGRYRATLVSLAGYPAPAVASLAAVRSLQLGYSRAWFIFAAGTLAVAIVFLIRNFWGFFWTGIVVGGSYYGGQQLEVQVLGLIVAGIAGYLAVEAVRNAWEQLSIIRIASGSGCDAEKVAIWWKFNAKVVGFLHLISVLLISGYASYLAVNPYWKGITDWISQFISTS